MANQEAGKITRKRRRDADDVGRMKKSRKFTVDPVDLRTNVGGEPPKQEIGQGENVFDFLFRESFENGSGGSGENPPSKSYRKRSVLTTTGVRSHSPTRTTLPIFVDITRRRVQISDFVFLSVTAILLALGLR